MNTENVQIARIGLKQAVLVVIISGLFGLIGSLIQYKIQQPTTKPEMVGFFSQKVPIGSIISSTIEPKIFSELAGDEKGFDPTLSTWVPADGREVAGSKYSKVLISRVPDLRGMFLRGLNYSEETVVRNDGREDPDGENRIAGQYQEDAIKAHKHEIAAEYAVDSNTQGTRVPSFDASARVREKGFWTKDEPEVSPETRPRNIAVFYYAKIN